MNNARDYDVDTETGTVGINCGPVEVSKWRPTVNTCFGYFKG